MKGNLHLQLMRRLSTIEVGHWKQFHDNLLDSLGENTVVQTAVWCVSCTLSVPKLLDRLRPSLTTYWLWWHTWRGWVWPWHQSPGTAGGLSGDQPVLGCKEAAVQGGISLISWRYSKVRAITEMFSPADAKGLSVLVRYEEYECHLEWRFFDSFVYLQGKLRQKFILMCRVNILSVCHRGAVQFHAYKVWPTW